MNLHISSLIQSKRWLELLPPPVLHDLLQVIVVKALSLCRHLPDLLRYSYFTDEHKCIYLIMEVVFPVLQEGLKALLDARNRDLLLCLVKTIIC